MRWGRIPDNDNLFRHCIYPFSFQGKRFAWGKWMKIYHESDGSLLASLAWERFVPTAELIRGYGCRVAFGMNEKQRIEGRTTKKDRRIYCGAYQLKGSAVRALATVGDLDEIVSANVVHRVEEGEIAHTDLRIVLKKSDDLNIEDTKTAIVDRLWSACRGPIRHTCDCDQKIEPHPSAALGIPPVGPYSDNRSSLARRWCISRFRVLNWIWRHSAPHREASSDNRSSLFRLWSTVKFQTCRWLWQNLSRNGSHSV